MRVWLAWIGVPCVLANPLASMNFNVNAHLLEVSMIFIVLVYIANFFIGKNKNRSIVKNWFQSIEPALNEQFAAVGYYDPPQKSKVFKVSHSVYRVYASGRVNCSGILATLEVIFAFELNC
jgi:hypothetical protein